MHFIHVMDYNLGDIVSSPLHYFPFPKDSIEMDFRNAPVMPGPLTIFGGGGMLHLGIDEWMEKMSQARRCVAWGIGVNYINDKDEKTADIPNKLKHMAFAGLRDRNIALSYGFDYVPCASCMHPAFDEKYEIIREVGVFHHYCHPINIPYAKMDNRTTKTLAHVLRFLGSCRKIITNSYHGAYWAHLLGREVTALGASNKFDFMPTESLEECRELNRKFYNKIKPLFT